MLTDVYCRHFTPHPLRFDVSKARFLNNNNSVLLPGCADLSRVGVSYLCVQARANPLKRTKSDEGRMCTRQTAANRRKYKWALSAVRRSQDAVGGGSSGDLFAAKLVSVRSKSSVGWLKASGRASERLGLLVWRYPVAGWSSSLSDVVFVVRRWF